MCSMNLVTNYWAVLVAALAFWVLGSVWFSVLFKKPWQSGMAKLGQKIQKPSSNEMQRSLWLPFY